MSKSVNHYLPHAAFATLALGALVAASMGLHNLRPAQPSTSAPTEQAVAPGKELVPAAQLRAEGKLIASPGMVDVGISRLVEPGLMSVVFTDRATANDFYAEARANGESVCLSDLGPQSPEFHEQRYWLRSC